MAIRVPFAGHSVKSHENRGGTIDVSACWLNARIHRRCLGLGTTLQDVAVLLANGVCAAYAAYNNGSNLTPNLPGYNSFNLIWVYEYDPNVDPWSVSATQCACLRGIGEGGILVERQPAAYAARRRLTASCVGPDTGRHADVGLPAVRVHRDRRRQLAQYSGAARHGHAGRSQAICSDGATTRHVCYRARAGSSRAMEWRIPICTPSTQTPITARSPRWLRLVWPQSRLHRRKLRNLPWYLGAHSLGGAMLSLAALDAVVSGASGRKSRWCSRSAVCTWAMDRSPAPIRATGTAERARRKSMRLRAQHGFAGAGDADRSLRPCRGRGDLCVADVGRLGQSLPLQHLHAHGAEPLGLIRWGKRKYPQ